MSIIIIREVTDWDLPGHTYAFDGEKILAYRKRGSQEIQVFVKPLRFERSRRRFETVRDTDTIRAFTTALTHKETHMIRDDFEYRDTIKRLDQLQARDDLQDHEVVEFNRLVQAVTDYEVNILGDWEDAT